MHDALTLWFFCVVKLFHLKFAWWLITCKLMSKEGHSQNKHPCKVEHLFPRNTLLWGCYLTWSDFSIRYKISVFHFFLQYPQQTQMVWKEKRRGQALWQEKCLLEWGFCFSKCLASCKGKVLLDNMPSNTLEVFFANALHDERSLCWLIRMSANLANALIWLTYVSVFLLVFYVYEITIGPLLLAIRWHVIILSIYGNVFMAKGTTWVFKIFL